MKIKKLHIENYKSLTNVKIVNPNPFTVFVGPNGSGKSNIFEATEFGNFCFRFSPNEAKSIYGLNNIISRKKIKKITELIYSESKTSSQKIELNSKTSDTQIKINLTIDKIEFFTRIGFGFLQYDSQPANIADLKKEQGYNQYFEEFSRIFIGNEQGRRLNLYDDKRLNLDASNLENVLKRILEDENSKNDIIEWLQIFIPEFEKIEVHTSKLSSKNELAIFEKRIEQPLTKNLISDGTYNILALLTAIFQSDKPQFLCIEEPENGLNPFVVKKLVGLFREACETKGHYIWINTHSQTIVNQLKPEELILVNKKEGATIIKQLKGTNLHGLDMDEAWLTNALGGGVPW